MTEMNITHASTHNSNQSGNRNAEMTPDILHEITRAIESLRFGSVEITVHEGRVTQIERREKVRFGSEPALKKAINK
jgi:hypothetical protein